MRFFRPSRETLLLLVQEYVNSVDPISKVLITHIQFLLLLNSWGFIFLLCVASVPSLFVEWHLRNCTLFLPNLVNQ